jgi:Flp pilus assembly protein TadD
MLYLLGVIDAQCGDYDLAIQHLEKVGQLNNAHADAHLALGGIFHQKEQFDDAIHAYRKAIEIDPDFAEAYENLGDIFRDRRQLGEAVACYKKALTYMPNAAAIHGNLGNIFKEKGQYDLATFYYRTALQYKPDYAEAYNNLGTIYQEQGRLDEAIAYYQKALQLNPNYSEAYENLGAAVHEKSQRDQGIRYSRDWLRFTIRLRLINVEMMIHAVINQCYFKTVHVQFHPDVTYDDNYTSGLKRQILDNIFHDSKIIDSSEKFFRDLDRLYAIRKYFDNRSLESMPLRNVNGSVTDFGKPDEVSLLRRLHHEFIGLAANIEAQLVRVLNS